MKSEWVQTTSDGVETTDTRYFILATDSQSIYNINMYNINMNLRWPNVIPDHRNVVTPQSVYRSEETTYVVTELLINPLGHVLELFWGGLWAAEAFLVVHEVLKGVCYLQSIGIDTIPMVYDIELHATGCKIST